MAVKELNAKEYEKSVEESYSSAESTLPFSNPPINNCLSSLNDRAVIKPAVKHDTNAEINYGSEGAISEEEISLVSDKVVNLNYQWAPLHTDQPRKTGG